MEEVVTRSRTGRRIIACKTTEKGKKVIALSGEIDGLLTTKRSKGRSTFELVLLA